MGKGSIWLGLKPTKRRRSGPAATLSRPVRGGFPAPPLTFIIMNTKAEITLKFRNTEVKTSTRLPLDDEGVDNALRLAIESAVFEARRSNPLVGSDEFHIGEEIKFS